MNNGADDVDSVIYGILTASNAGYLSGLEMWQNFLRTHNRDIIERIIMRKAVIEKYGC